MHIFFRKIVMEPYTFKAMYRKRTRTFLSGVNDSNEEKEEADVLVDLESVEKKVGMMVKFTQRAKKLSTASMESECDFFLANTMNFLTRTTIMNINTTTINTMMTVPCVSLKTDFEELEAFDPLPTNRQNGLDNEELTQGNNFQ